MPKERKAVTLQKGGTSIYLQKRGTRIFHEGVAGDTIDTVRSNVDALLGEGHFDQLRAVGVVGGSPDWLYFVNA
jgi:hypothetical protein